MNRPRALSPSPRFLRAATALALLIGSAISGAPLYAPPMTGDPTQFQARQDAWEAETGRKSRITLYGQVGLIDLPPWVNASTIQLTQQAWNNPFEADLSQLASMFPDFEQAFELMERARELDDCGRFPDELNSPAPNFPNIVATSQMLNCRAQLRANAGDIDGAIRDLGTIWIAGRSFEAEAGTLPSVKRALALRGMAAQMIMALLRKHGLTAEQRADLRGLLLKDAQKDGETSVHRAMLADFDKVSQMVRESPLKQNPESMEETAAMLKEALDKMDLPSPAERFAQAAKYDAVADEAAMKYRASRSYAFPMRQTLVLETISIAMERICVLATLVLDANEAAADGMAGDEAIADLAKLFPDQLVDPFTDKPLLLLNKGGDQFAIVSAGPDLVLSAPRYWLPYTPAMGPDGRGDVILYRIPLKGVAKLDPADEESAKEDEPAGEGAASGVAPSEEASAAEPATEAP